PGRIALVAFDPVQIGVRPGAIPVMRILAAAMRLVPVALRLPPQGLQWQAGSGRRRRTGERGFELLELHLGSPAMRHPRAYPRISEMAESSPAMTKEGRPYRAAPSHASRRSSRSRIRYQPPTTGRNQ